MKKRLVISAVLVLLPYLYPTVVCSQTSIVPWHSFNMGFTMDTSQTVMIWSTVGQVLAGRGNDGDTRIKSGFLVVLHKWQPPNAINEEEGLPRTFALHQNYPNPFNPTTTIRFDLPSTTDVYIVVYDLLGREIAFLLDQRLEMGYHQLTWNGCDQSGRELPTGIYIVLMVTLEYTKSIKMVMLK